MIALRWSIFSVLALVGGLITLANWGIAVRYYVSGKHASMFPLIGGLFGAVSFAIVPLDTLSSLWWLPPIVDIGCAPSVLLYVIYIVWHSISKS
jgi:hypothetical protein